MPSLLIVEVDPSDPASETSFRAWKACVDAARSHDLRDLHSPASTDEVREAFRATAAARALLLAACDGGQVVGAASVVLALSDNTRQARVELDVLPSARGRGVGRALLGAVEEAARRHRRSTVTVEQSSLDGATDLATGFAARFGYSAALVEQRSRLDLPAGAGDLDRVLAGLDATVAEVGPDRSPDGYRLLVFDGEVPAKHLAGRAVLASRMSIDAPHDELDLEEEVWDADRVRQRMATARAQGRRLLEVAAQDERSGELAGFTAIAVALHTPSRAYQWDTLVAAHHRGHRLGAAMKARALRELLAAVPQVREVTTWNHPGNRPMLALNEAMGFRRVAVATQWQRPADPV